MRISPLTTVAPHAHMCSTPQRQISIPNAATPNACDLVRNVGVLGPCPPVEQPHGAAAAHPWPANAKPSESSSDEYASLMSGTSGRSSGRSSDAEAEKKEKAPLSGHASQENVVGSSAAHARGDGAAAGRTGGTREGRLNEVHEELAKEFEGAQKELHDEFAGIIRDIRGEGAGPGSLREEITREYQGIKQELWDTIQEVREAWNQGHRFLRPW